MGFKLAIEIRIFQHYKSSESAFQPSVNEHAWDHLREVSAYGEGGGGGGWGQNVVFMCN